MVVDQTGYDKDMAKKLHLASSRFLLVIPSFCLGICVCPKLGDSPWEILVYPVPDVTLTDHHLWLGFVEKRRIPPNHNSKRDVPYHTIPCSIFWISAANSRPGTNIALWRSLASRQWLFSGVPPPSSFPSWHQWRRNCGECRIPQSPEKNQPVWGWLADQCGMWLKNWDSLKQNCWKWWSWVSAMRIDQIWAFPKFRRTSPSGAWTTMGQSAAWGKVNLKSSNSFTSSPQFSVNDWNPTRNSYYLHTSVLMLSHQIYSLLIKRGNAKSTIYRWFYQV